MEPQDESVYNVEAYGPEIHEPEKIPIFLPVKTKRVMSEKQLAALAKGRMLGVEKLKLKGAMTNKVKETNRELNKVKESEKVDNIEDLRKLNDLNFIRKSIENMTSKFNTIDTNFNNIHSKFDGYLTDREKRKNMKNENTIQKTIQKELPKTMQDMLFKQKTDQQMANNPYLGRV
jgi:DNA polymerase sigma